MAIEPPFRPRDASGEAARESSFDADAREAEAPDGLPRTPPCVFCDGGETEIMSAFGSQLSVSTYWCRDCGSPFEFMKWAAGSE